MEINFSTSGNITISPGHQVFPTQLWPYVIHSGLAPIISYGSFIIFQDPRMA